MTYTHPDFLANNPYNDDFDDTKRFLRILFKPGYSVQARELTQLQTLLQNQISKFGDHIFRDGSLVFGGLTSLNRVSFVRVNANYIVSNLQNVVDQIIINYNNTTKAKCLYVLPAEGTDNTAILFLQYLTGNQFVSGERLYVNDVATSLTAAWGGITSDPVTVVPVTQTPTGTATLASVDEGIFYVDGFFVSNKKQSVPLYSFVNEKRYFDEPSNKIGFYVNRGVINSISDTTLKDPANGSYNFNAPGADRYRIDLQLKSEVYVGDATSFTATDLSSKDFIELARVVDGKLTFIKKIPSYSDILEVFARRTYDESGNYTVKPFTINIKENVKRNKMAFTITLTQGSISSTAETNLAFVLPTTPTVSYEISSGQMTQLPPNIGDILVANDTANTEYKIVGITSINLTNGTANIIVVPEDKYVSSTNNPYTNGSIILGSRFSLKRQGSSTVETENFYRNTSNQIVIVTDILGSKSLFETPAGDPNKFSVEIGNGKAYVFGYEYETTTPITISTDKPRKISSVSNEILDTSLGNYVKVYSSGSYFDDTNKKYDTTFDLNDFPDVLLNKKFVTLLLPNLNTNYSTFNVRYYTPSTRKSINTFTPTYNWYNWESAVSNTLTDAEKINKQYFYPDLVFIQSTTGQNVLKKELENTDYETSGFIERRETGDVQEYTTLLPNDNATNKPKSYGNADIKPEILDSSYETESNISRLVFNEAWHGDFKTGYDSSFEASFEQGAYNPAVNKLTRKYVNDNTNYVYQVDYINLGAVPVDDSGNVSITNLQNYIRVKRAYTRAWVPGSTRDTGAITPSSLYIHIPTSNVVFGPDIGVSRGFCLPGTNPTVQESGVVFNPSESKEISYGSSIAASSQEANVVEITLLTTPNVSSCAATLGSITTRGFGSYTEGSTVTQTYIRYDGPTTTGGVPVTVQGTVVKVVSSTGSHKLFVKLLGSTGDFIPQSYESVKNAYGEFKYQGISALLMSDNILTAPICACHTISNTDLLDDKTGTCGIFTTINFSEPGTYGDYTVGEIVYQYDVDYMPIDNLSNPTNFDGTKILAQGTVVSWDKNTSTLTLIVTKNEFKQKSGWIFGRTSGVGYGGRGWSTNYHKTSTASYTGFSSVNEIEKVRGVIVWVRPNVTSYTSHGFVDEFNTSNPSIRKIAYQTRSYTEENILQSPWTELNLINQPVSQTYVDADQQQFTANGIIKYFKQGGPVSGPSIITLEADPLDRDSFAFKIKTPNLISGPTAANGTKLVFNFLNAEKIKPQTSIYDPLQTQASSVGEIVTSSVVGKAKVKQIKYVAKTNSLVSGQEQYHVYLTDITPYSIEGSLFRINNLYSLTREIGGKETTMFLVGDVSSDTSTEYDLNEPKNNTLLYEYPVGDKIKEVTDLTYELQIDLKATLNTTTRKLTFVTDVPGSTKFKGSYTSGSSTLIDQSIGSEYILIANNSQIIDFTDTTLIQSIRVTEATNKTLEITFTSTGISSLSTGEYRLICPIVIEGNLTSNIRTKTKKRNIELARFDPVTGTMTLRKSDVISIDSCINLSQSKELPPEAIKLNNNQTPNLYRLSTVTGNEKWRDLQILGTNGTVTTQPNGLWCLISYTYYDHGTVYGPIIPASYVDGYDTIPTFVDPITNQKITLDSVIDFRPFERLDDSGKIVTSGIYGVPISGSRMNVSYSYYLPQYYKLILSRDRTFNLINGEPSTNPKYPNDLPNAMTLFKIEMPAYLTNASDTKVVALNHQRYTMDDIRSLEDRIENIEYVTRLSYLEQTAKNISILGSNSQERPKTSILVDSFINHEIGDTVNPDYNICIDSSNNSLRPTYDINQLSLKLDKTQSTGSYLITKENQVSVNFGVSYAPNILTMKHRITPVIKQLLSTGTTQINPFSNTVWFGTMTASSYRNPSFDMDSKPYILSNFNGENDTFQNMSFSPINNYLSGFGTKWNFWQTNWQGYIDNPTNVKTFLGRVEDQIKALTPRTPRKKIGERSVNIDVVPYMPATTIGVYARGLKPSTTVYPYFDGIRVESYITSGILNNLVKTDAFGNVNLIINIPAGVFQSGEKTFVLMDNTNNDKTLCTTYAEFTFSNSAQQESYDYYGTFGNKIVSQETDPINDYQTIIAQTFLVDPKQYPKGMYARKIDIYFNSIDTTASGLPITLELRPVSNGTPLVGPGTSAYPNSTVTLRPNSIAIINGVVTAQNGTGFYFDAPVHLLPGEHAIVLKTNSSNYSVYTSEVGAQVIGTETRATPQPYVGKMMRTNNSQNWTIFENIDMTFNVHRCEFENSAKVVFTDPIEQRPEVQFSVLNVNMSYSDLSSSSVSTTIKTINKSSTSDILFETEETMIVPNTNIETDKLKYFKYNGQSFNLIVNMISDGIIAPMIDLDSIRVFAIKNLISSMNGSGFAKGSTTITKEENETFPYSTVHEDFSNARYITKVVTLDPDMETRDCYVYFKINKPRGTDVKLYIKRQFADNDINMNEIEYEELEQKSSMTYSSDPNKYTEVYYKIPDARALNPFIRYALKIVMFADTEGSALVPKIKDLKIITVA